MALVLKDRVRETSTTTGTGTLTLSGAVAGYQSFSAIGTGNTTYYSIVTSTDWEVGIGTWTSPDQLSRDTILASTNAGAAVDFAAGSKDVFCTFPAEAFAVPPAIGSTTPNAVTSNLLKAKNTKTPKWSTSTTDYNYWGAPNIVLTSTEPPISVGDYVVGPYIPYGATVTSVWYDDTDMFAWAIALSKPQTNTDVYGVTIYFYDAPRSSRLLLDDTLETGVTAEIYIDKLDKRVHFNASDGTTDYPVAFDSDIKLKGMTVGTGNFNDLSCVAIGNQALVVNGGVNNIAIGSVTLLNNTGGYMNTAVGATAMYSNTFGGWNFGLGAGALYFNIGGNYNVAIGGLALAGGDNSAVSSGATASNNVAVGNFALEGSLVGLTAGYTFGSQNVAIGNNVAQYGMGSYNTLIGHTAATNLQSGSYNTFVGKSAGAAVTTANNNTFVGYNAGSAVGAVSNTVILGSYTGSGATSDTIYLSDGAGNIRLTMTSSAVTTTQRIGVGVTSPTASVHLKAGTVTAFTAPLKFDSGVKLTSPEAGAFEYDGVKWYATSSETGSSRSVLENTYQYYTTATSSAIGAAIADLFASAAFTMQAGGVYVIEWHPYLTKATAGTLTFTVTTSQTPQSVTAGYCNAQSALTASNAVVAGATTTTTIPVSASLANGAVVYMPVSAVVTANATTGGTVKLQITNSAGTVTLGRGSHIIVRRLSAATTTGAFA